MIVGSLAQDATGDFSQDQRKVLNIAHRGARAFAPENTLEAFDKAAELGADMVELDVQLTADRQVVVLHDETLERCSDVRGRFPDRSDYAVKSFTLREIQSLDAGSWFVHALDAVPQERPAFLRSLTDDEVRRHIPPAARAHFASGRVRHPTLEEAMVRITERKLSTNVELKGSLPGVLELAEEVVRLLERIHLCDRVLVSAFEHAALLRTKELQGAIATGVLVRAPLPDPVRYCRELMRAAAYHPGCQADSDAVGFNSDYYRQTGRLPEEPLRSLRAAGIQVNVWTENDPARMRTLIAAGASGIITDYPNRRALVAG
jgi:glycerophosphoryl diester phosphodiesterase